MVLIDDPENLPEGNHADGLQFWTEGYTTVRRNRIEGWSNAAILIKSDVAPRTGFDKDGDPIANIIIDENYFGSNSINYYYLRVNRGNRYPSNDWQARPRYITIINNWFESKPAIDGSEFFYPIHTASVNNCGDGADEVAIYVRTEAERSEGIARQNAYPAVLTYRETTLGWHSSSVDARTWIVWNNNRYVEDNSEVRPYGMCAVSDNGWYDLTNERTAFVLVSEDAKLLDLTIVPYQLTPAFDPDVTEYTIDIPYNVDSLSSLAITASDSNATVAVSDNSNFIAGENIVTIEVTAKDDNTTEIYTIVVSKASAPSFATIDCNLSVNEGKLECQSLGTVIQMTGQTSGVTYKFIKFSDDTYNNNLVGANMWMLGDNYCVLHAGKSSACVRSSGTVHNTYQVWNPTATNDRYNNWTTMMSTNNSIWNRVLSPMYADLPSTIDSVDKDNAVLSYPFDMNSITDVTGTNLATESDCYLTNPTNDNNISITNCTHTAKISLPSYQEWQNGLGGKGYYAPSDTPAAEYQKARFNGQYGATGKYGLFASWHPWLRTPLASDTDNVWHVYGSTATYAVGFGTTSLSNGASPVLYLSSNLETGCGAGIYTNPYRLGDDICNTSPFLTVNDPIVVRYVNVASVSGSLNLDITGAITDPDQNQIVTIEATISGLTASGWQATPLNSSPYTLTFDSNLLIEGEYENIIIEAFDNAEDLPVVVQETLDKIIVDKTFPTATFSAMGGSSNDNGTTWQVAPTISFIALDVSSNDPNASNFRSGLRGYKFSWFNNTNVGTDYTTQCSTLLDGHDFTSGTTTIPSNGTHTLCLSATDNVDNTYVTYKTFTLNTASPSIISEVTSGTQGDDSWYLNNPTLTLSASDNNDSGLASIVYKYVPISLVGTGSYVDGYDVTLDNTATTSAVTGASAILDLTIPAGSYRVYFATIDATEGIKSETYYEDIKVDLASPVSVIESVEYGESTTEVPLSSDDPNYVLYQNTNQVSASDTISLQVFTDMNSDSGTDALTLSLNMFDPLSADLTQAAPSGMSSGINTCLLEVRSANILTDGSGKIESTFDEILSQVPPDDEAGQDDGEAGPPDGEADTTQIEVIDFSPWTTLSTTCSDSYNLTPQASTLYQLRLSATDVAGHQGNVYTSQTVIYNLSKIYTPDFVEIDGNVLSADLASNIYTIECRETLNQVPPDGEAGQGDGGEDGMTQEVCTPDHFDITGSLSSTTQATEYELCLAINGVSIPKCTTVTTSTENITNYSLLFTTTDFPNDIDVFPGGTLTITDTASHNSITKQANIVFQIKRTRPELVPTVQMREYVHMIDSRLN